MNETAATTRHQEATIAPCDGELRYIANVIADRGYPHTTAVMHTVLQIFDGEAWQPLESAEGIAVVNRIIRRLIGPSPSRPRSD